MEISSDPDRILVAASPDIGYSAIAKQLSQLLSAHTVERLIFAEANKDLVKFAKGFWTDPEFAPVKGRSDTKKLLDKTGLLLLLWDGEGLTRLLFEARLREIPTKVVPIQVTRVVNKQITEQYDAYIGRGTPWGNPYAIGHGEGPDREEVIERYKAYFYEKLESDQSFRRGILGLKGMRLACFCKPAACHGDVIANYLDNEVGDATEEDSQ